MKINFEAVALIPSLLEGVSFFPFYPTLEFSLPETLCLALEVLSGSTLWRCSSSSPALVVRVAVVKQSEFPWSVNLYTRDLDAWNRQNDTNRMRNECMGSVHIVRWTRGVPKFGLPCHYAPQICEDQDEKLRE